MEYAFCKDFNFDGSTTTFDVTVEKGTEVTVEGCVYYIYPSSGFATLKQINVEYNTSSPGSNKIADYSVKENQTFTIPAEVQGCKVIFVGECLSNEKSVILVPSATGGTSSKFRALFQGNGNSVNIVFEGDVVLNCNPFTSMWKQKFGSGSAATDTQYKFNITFEKDVYVNSVSSYYSDKYHLSPSILNLCGLASLNINGVYKGAFVGTGSVPEFTTEVASEKSLTNTTIGRITFDRNLSFNAQAINTPNNKATKIASLYLLSNSVFDIEGNDVDGYKLTSSGVEVCSSVTSYKDAILFTMIDGRLTVNEVLEKGSVKQAVAPTTIPQNMRFDDWYVDAEYQTRYVAEALTVDTTVYVRCVIDSYIVNFSDGINPISGLKAGDVISLSYVSKDGSEFNGWMINDLLLGAQYIVSARDADESGNIFLTASFSEKVDDVKTTWSLTVTGADGKVFWTKSNEIGSYGMITVILGEFEKADIPASAEYSVGKISNNTFMIYSVNDADITVAMNIAAATKATAYTVSLTEVAKIQGDDTVPGFKATVTAKDGYIDTAGTFLVRYVYKEMDAETGLWCFTTSGQTAGVNDWEIDISEIGTVGTYSKDMYLEKSGAYLVYGFATYAVESASVTGGVEVFTSPVIMSVSQIQAVIGKP